MNKEELLRAKALAPVPITRYLDGYDQCDIADSEIQYRLEEDDEVKARLAAAGAEGRAAVEQEVRDEVNADSDVYERAFDDLCENLTDDLYSLARIKRPISPGAKPVMYFRLDVNNFGWRNQSGHKYVRVENARQLIQALLPNCDCTYRFFKVKHGRKLAMQNFHHDSPVGAEWYTITPCAASTYEANK